MENRIRVIEEGLNKCIKCDYFKRELCGVYFDHNLPDITEEQWYMLSEEERNARLGMSTRYKCLEADIDEDLDAKTKYHWPEDSKTRLRLLARCKVMLDQIPDNNVFWSKHGEGISNAIYDLIGQMDFKALEDGNDLIDEIRMVGIEYNRESILYPRYTEGLVKHYIDQLQSNSQLNLEETPRLDIGTQVGSVNNRFNISHNTPLEIFHYYFAGQPAKDLIEYILIHNHFQEIILDSWRSNKELYDDDIYIDIYYYKNFCFDYWEELREEISKGIGERVNNQVAMKKYVYSLLRPFSYISRYLYSREKDSCMYKEAADFLYDFVFYENKKYERYQSQKEQLIDKINKGEFSASEIPAIELLNLDAFKVITREQGDMYFHMKNMDESILLEYLYRGLHQFAFLIEGQLLENGHDKSLLDYQKECGVILVDKIDAIDIASACGWTMEYAFSLLRDGSDKENASMSLRESTTTMQISTKDGKKVIAQASSNTEEYLKTHPGLQQYLQALQQEGYLDEQYVWIRVKGFSLYAGWASKIIISNVSGVRYEDLTNIIKVKGLGDAACKCQNKYDKQAAIAACFNKHNLRATFSK